MNVPLETPVNAVDPKPRGAFWLIFGTVCILHVCVWIGWFTLAAHHPVAEVPLATARK